MQDDLVGVVDRNLQMQVHIEGRLHQRVIHPIKILHLLELRLAMSSHDHLMPVSVNVPLAEGDRLGQDVVTRADQVYEEHLVVPHKAENALVVVASALGAECDDYALARMRFHDTFRQ